MTDLINQNNTQTDFSQINPIQPEPTPIIPPTPTPTPPPQPSTQQLPPLPPTPTQAPQQPITQPNSDFKESLTTDGKFDMNKLKELLQKYLVDKSPIALPESAKNFLVTIVPIVTLIGVIISLPVMLAYFGVSLIALPFASATRYGFSHYLSMAQTFGTFIFEIILIPGLFKKTAKAWNLLFYFSIFTLILNLMSFNLASALIGAVLSFYVLFQCRSKYIN